MRKYMDKKREGFVQAPLSFCGDNILIGIGQLFQLFIYRCIPEHIRLGNDPEFTVKVIIDCLNCIWVKTIFVEQGSPWKNGYIALFNGN
jgi:hypothetical protein